MTNAVTVDMDFALGYDAYPCEWMTGDTACGQPSEYFVQRFPATGMVRTAHKMTCARCLKLMQPLDKVGAVKERVIALSEFCNLKGLTIE